MRRAHPCRCRGFDAPLRLTAGLLNHAAKPFRSSTPLGERSFGGNRRAISNFKAARSLRADYGSAMMSAIWDPTRYDP